jgi:hypothetical protein
VRDDQRREQLLQELTAKLSEYREASRLGAMRTSRASPASSMDLNRLNLDRLMQLQREIAALTRSIEALPRPDSAADRRADLARQLEEAERALGMLDERANDPKRDALALEVRHLALLLELT